ncbi:hypothetical protein [Methanothermobacter sp. THM-2]|nr:hypothetical protein [Methanothermobacter sp. THM-2]
MSARVLRDGIVYRHSGSLRDMALETVKEFDDFKHGDIPVRRISRSNN